MRGKISNQIPTTRPADTRNKLYTVFKEPLQYLLHNDDDDYVYVPHHEVDAQISEQLESQESNCQFIVGYTGVGKTATVKSHFGKLRNPEVFQEEKRIRIPFWFQHHGSVQTQGAKELELRLKTTVRKLMDVYEIELKKSKIYDFLQSVRSDFLEYGSDLTQPLDVENSVDKFMVHDPIGYAKTCLQIVILESGIKKVDIIMDDIEQYEHKVLRPMVQEILALHSDLNEYTTDDISIHTFISCRPFSASAFEKDYQIKSFSRNPDIWIRQPVAIKDIFRSRFDHVMKTIGAPKGRTPEQWNDALKILNVVISRINSVAVALPDLHNYNMRDSMNALVEILSNRRWIQGKGNASAVLTEQAFEDTSSEVTLLRAWAMGESSIYTESGSRLPNLLANEENGDVDFFKIFVIEYLRNRCESAFPGHRNCASREKLIEELIPLLSGWTTDEFDYKHVLDTLVANIENMKYQFLILEDSVIRQKQSVNFIYLLPKAEAIWKICNRSSVFFEIWRDDTWIDGRYTDVDYVTCGTCELSKPEIFIEVAKFIRFIANRQEKFFRKAKDEGRVDYAIQMLGRERFVQVAIHGLTQSAHKYYGRGSIPDQLLKELNSAQKNVDSLSQYWDSRTTKSD